MAVAADPDLDAGLAGRRARVARLDLADAGAAVAGDGVAVVALLAVRGLDDAVAAVLELLAGHARRGAGVARLDLTGRRCSRRPSVVLPSSHCSPFSTMPSPHTGGCVVIMQGWPGDGARVAGLDLAVGGAAVAVRGVAVVALLRCPRSCRRRTPASRCRCRACRAWAGVAGLDLADAGAAVARDGVAVVAGLPGLDHAVAADGGRPRVGAAVAARIRRARRARRSRTGR